ncbi:MAG: putative addiction module antidote protein [Thermomonas sp.]|uniref:addiction module antidote protein n=1 Tax=Thermomonas sp. TaxID=1971895 RepID=UPI001EB36DD6|nr:addiction module antidote protein [Thermomonas sp.]MBV2209518.1 putative addiction module antidote protein [Thermomonas sp.]
MTTKTTQFDVQAHLQTDEDCRLFLEAVFEDGGDDVSYIAQAIGEVVRARGMMQLARETGLSRESLYRALSAEGNPSFATVLKVMHALGMQLTPTAA